MAVFDIFKDWMPSINEKRSYLFDGVDTEMVEKEYPAFMVNRALSQTADTVFAANEIQRYASTLDPKLQYDFLYHFIPKKKRFGKWAKGEKHEEVSLIMDCYNVSRRKAEELLALHSDDDFNSMREYLNKGGKHGKDLG